MYMFMFKLASNPTIHTGDTCTSIAVKTFFFGLMLPLNWGHGKHAKLYFLSMTRRLNVLYQCMKFR